MARLRRSSAAVRTPEPRTTGCGRPGVGEGCLERNKRWCNKRGCKSKKCGNTQNWPNLREVGRICATFSQICATLRNCFCNIYAHLREIYGPVCYGTVRSCLRKARGASDSRAFRLAEAGHWTLSRRLQIRVLSALTGTRPDKTKTLIWLSSLNFVNLVNFAKVC